MSIVSFPWKSRIMMRARRAPAWVVLAAATCWGSVCAGGEPTIAQRVATLRSVTYYRFGTKLENLSSELLSRDIARAKRIGLNGMWLVVTWRSLSPVALPEPRLHEPSWRKLDAVIDLLSRQGFSIVFPLGYFGRGWSPKGIPNDRVGEWIVDDVMWTAFQEHVIRLTRRYADRPNILWMFYTESFQGPLKAYDRLSVAKQSFRDYCRRRNADVGHWNTRWGSDYASLADVGMADGRAKRGAVRWEDHFRWMCSVLRNRYGALARKLKTQVGVRGLVGFHDNALITKNWAKGDTPVPEDNPYDFLSFTAYGPGKGTIDARMNEVGQVYRRFRSRYPAIPLVIGETGVPTLVRDEAIQADYLSAIARFARAHDLGMNIWMWQDFKGSSAAQRSFGLLRLDGTEKPAVDALRKAFTRDTP